MNRQTSAAQIWAKIEPELIAAGLATGSLLVQRARMIRAIGRALGNRKTPAIDELRNLPATGVENNRQATAGAIRQSKGATPVTAVAAVGEAPTSVADVEDAPALGIGVRDDAAHRPAAHVAQDRRVARHRPVGQDHRGVKMRRIDDQHDDSIVDEKLARYLERACCGYSGDDSVDYR